MAAPAGGTGYKFMEMLDQLDLSAIYDSYDGTKAGRPAFDPKMMVDLLLYTFGQIEEVRGFRRFLLRGLENMTSEWDLICLTHNILKLFRSGLMTKAA